MSRIGMVSYILLQTTRRMHTWCESQSALTLTWMKSSINGTRSLFFSTHWQATCLHGQASVSDLCLTSEPSCCSQTRNSWRRQQYCVTIIKVLLFFTHMTACQLQHTQNFAAQSRKVVSKVREEAENDDSRANPLLVVWQPDESHGFQVLSGCDPVRNRGYQLVALNSDVDEGNASYHKRDNTGVLAVEMRSRIELSTNMMLLHVFSIKLGLHYQCARSREL
jgi:hypothetical protein